MSIKMFMMLVGNIRNGLHIQIAVLNIEQPHIAPFRMVTNQGKFIIGQSRGFVENLAGYIQFANIVKQGTSRESH